MSGVHKYPTISFRVSPRQRKEVIYKLVQELETMQTTIKEVAGQLEQGKTDISAEGLEDMKHDFLDMLKAIFWMLDGAKYLWENQQENGNAPAD